MGLALLFAGQPLVAQTPLSLEEAVFSGLKNNRGLRIQRLEVDIAGAFTEIERGDFDLELFGGMNYSEEEASETDRATREQFSVSGNDWRAEVGVRRDFSTGTSVEVGVRADRSVSDRAPEQQSVRWGLSVRQNLLRGFGPGTNLAQLRQAEFAEAASIFELQGFAEALIADIEIGYWRWYAAIEALKVFEVGVQVAEEQLESVLYQIEVGNLPGNEAAAARAELASRRQGLIDARSDVKQRAYALSQSMDAVVDPELALDRAPSSQASAAEGFSSDPSDRIALALQQRPEIGEAQLQLQSDRLRLVVTKNGRLPQLDFFIDLGSTGYSDTLLEAYRNSDGPSYDFTVGLTFSRAWGNRQARGRDRAARATVGQSEEALENLRNLVRLDVLLAVNEVERTLELIDATGETRLFREQTLAAEQGRFEVGTSTSFDVSRAQRDLIASQLAEINALVEHQIARVALLRSEGMLLQMRGLNVRD